MMKRQSNSLLPFLKIQKPSTYSRIETEETNSAIAIGQLSVEVRTRAGLFFWGYVCGCQQHGLLNYRILLNTQGCL